MSKLTRFFAMTVCASMVITTARAHGQTLIGFQNAMQSAADVIVTAVGSTTPVQFAIGANNVVNFNFGAGTLFNIQVIPRDAPDSGFRFANVNLRNLAATTTSGILRLDGEFRPDQQRLICYRRGLCRHRCYCYWARVRGERIAVDLTSSLKGGGTFMLESPKMSYSNEWHSRNS